MGAIDDALTAAAEDTQPSMIIGSTGLKQYSGFVDEEFLARLRGQNAIRVYREMIDNSPAVAAALNVIKMLIRQVDWRIEPADESDAAKVEQEDTETALEDMSHTFEDFLSEVLSFIWAGYSYFEIIYKLRRGPDQEDPMLRSRFNDGKWGWRKLEVRAQETVYRWIFDEEDNGLLGMIQLDPVSRKGPVFLPIDKSLLFRTETFKGNPEGKALIRPAVIPYWYSKQIQKFEAIGVERNLAGMPVMEVPPELLLEDASASDKATRAMLETFVTQLRMDERWGGLLPSELNPDGTPSGYRFKLMQSSGRRLLDPDTIVKRHRSEILMLFLAQFLTLGTEGSHGSFSLASNMTDLFATAIGSLMDNIASVINRFLIPRRQRLNGRPHELDPWITHGDIEGPELDKVADYIQKLAASGVIGANPALERRVLEIADLPQPPEEDKMEGLPASLAENRIDAAGRTTLSPEQVNTILEVNRALKNKHLDRESAIATLAASLGLEPDEAEKFIPAEKDEEQTSPPLPMPSPNGSQEGQPGGQQQEGDQPSEQPQDGED